MLSVFIIKIYLTYIPKNHRIKASIMTKLSTKKTTTFKRSLIFSAVSLITLSLAGCGEEDRIPTNTTQSKVTSLSATTDKDFVGVGNTDTAKDVIEKTPITDIESNKNLESLAIKTVENYDKKPKVSKSEVGEIETKLRNIYVVDGDTIYGENQDGEQIKIRMTGIDAPESDQLLGDVSKLSLQDCVDQSSDIKVVVQTSNSTDKYGRTLGKVMVGDTDCNLWQVGSGMAWFYKQYANQLGGNDAALYEQGEVEAKEMKAGIWMEDIEPAWEYRQKNNAK